MENKITNVTCFYTRGDGWFKVTYYDFEAKQVKTHRFKSMLSLRSFLEEYYKKHNVKFTLRKQPED